MVHRADCMWILAVLLAACQLLSRIQAEVQPESSAYCNLSSTACRCVARVGRALVERSQEEPLCRSLLQQASQLARIAGRRVAGAPAAEIHRRATCK